LEVKALVTNVARAGFYIDEKIDITTINAKYVFSFELGVMLDVAVEIPLALKDLLQLSR